MRTCLIIGVLFATMIVPSTFASTGNTGSTLSQSDVQSIRDAADYIVASQLPNGLISMSPDKNVWGVPYFANLAGIGLLRAYQVTGDRLYLRAVLRYSDWYERCMNRDGTIYDWTGTRDAPVPTYSYDSSDSYPATYISLCYQISCVTRDRAWLMRKYPTIIRSVNGILLTWQNDGLTFAKPDYKVKYLMDNLEVHVGLRAAVKIAETLHSSKANTWKALLEQNRLGLRQLWLGQDDRFAMAMFEDGNLDHDWVDWYPDGMSNAMALAYILCPDDSQAKPIAQAIRDMWPAAHDYWRFIALWKFGCKDDAIAVRGNMGSEAVYSVDKGLYIRSFVPEKDDFFYTSEYLLLPDLHPRPQVSVFAR